jgi:hypothetical protein
MASNADQRNDPGREWGLPRPARRYGNAAKRLPDGFAGRHNAAPAPGLRRRATAADDLREAGRREAEEGKPALPEIVAAIEEFRAELPRTGVGGLYLQFRCRGGRWAQVTLEDVRVALAGIEAAARRQLWRPSDTAPNGPETGGPGNGGPENGGPGNGGPGNSSSRNGSAGNGGPGNGGRGDDGQQESGSEPRPRPAPRTPHCSWPQFQQAVAELSGPDADVTAIVGLLNERGWRAGPDDVTRALRRVKAANAARNLLPGRSLPTPRQAAPGLCPACEVPITDLGMCRCS